MGGIKLTLRPRRFYLGPVIFGYPLNMAAPQNPIRDARA